MFPVRLVVLCVAYVHGFSGGYALFFAFSAIVGDCWSVYEQVRTDETRNVFSLKEAGRRKICFEHVNVATDTRFLPSSERMGFTVKTPEFILALFNNCFVLLLFNFIRHIIKRRLTVFIHK